MSTGSTASEGGTNRFVYIVAGVCGPGWSVVRLRHGHHLRRAVVHPDDFGLSDTAQQIVVASLLLGAVFGALFGGPLADRIGRRNAIMIAAVIFMLGSLASALATGAAFLAIARFVLGLAVGGAGMVVPVYIAESSPSRVRGSLVSLQQFLITVGILLSYGINYLLADAEAWRWMLGLGVVPALALLVGMFFLPESPRWLVGMDRDEEARAVLARTRDTDEDVDEEMQSIAGARARRGTYPLQGPAEVPLQAGAHGRGRGRVYQPDGGGQRRHLLRPEHPLRRGLRRLGSHPGHDRHRARQLPGDGRGPAYPSTG